MRWMVLHKFSTSAWHQDFSDSTSVLLTWLTGSLKFVMSPARNDTFSSSDNALKTNQPKKGISSRTIWKCTEKNMHRSISIEKTDSRVCFNVTRDRTIPKKVKWTATYKLAMQHNQFNLTTEHAMTTRFRLPTFAECDSDPYDLLVTTPCNFIWNSTHAKCRL